MQTKRSQSGNVVIMILVAIALFGALAYTFMRGSQQGQGNLTGNQARVAAQEILNYNVSLERGVQKLLSRGCSENELGFGNTVFTTHGGTAMYTDTHNSNRPSSGQCDVFKSSGAGLVAQTISVSAQQPWPAITNGNTAVGSAVFTSTRIPEVGNNLRSDLFVIWNNVTPSVCKAYNTIANISNSSNNMPNGALAGHQDYNGTFNDTYTFTDIDGVLAGKTAFCYQDVGDSSRGAIVHVLITR